MNNRHAVAVRYFAIALLIPFVLLWQQPFQAASAEDNGAPGLFRAGFLQRVFYKTDPRDAKAVLEVYSREISSRLELKANAKVVMFGSIETMSDALRNGELEMASMPSVDYLRIRNKVSLIPSFVGTNSNGQGIDYVVVTRKDSANHSFSDLKGKSILLPPIALFEPCHIWLEVLLMKTAKGDQGTFFRQVKESSSLSSAVTAVFFRQADAAIVSRTALDTCRQLNPQLETQLTILAESPNLSDSVVCMLPNTSERLRNDINRALLQLNDSKSGKQIYTIFQISGMSPFKTVYLEGLENLLREHKRLKTKTALKK